MTHSPLNQTNFASPSSSINTMQSIQNNINNIVNTIPHFHSEIKDLFEIEKRLIDTLGFISLDSEIDMDRLLGKSNHKELMEKYQQHENICEHISESLKALESYHNLRKQAI